MSEQLVERIMLAMSTYADTLKASSRDAPFIRSHRRDLSLVVIAEIEKDHVIVPRADMQRLRGVIESVCSQILVLPHRSRSRDRAYPVSTWVNGQAHDP
jgi:hypothetical protein